MPQYRRINLFGRPGAGKSTVAPRLCHELRWRGVKVEYVNEYVKYWAYTDRDIESFDQVYIFGKQMNSEDRMLHHAQQDYIISDSPLLIQYCYASLANDPVSEPLLELVRLFDKKYPPYNIFLLPHNADFVQEGRYHDPAAAQRSADIMQEVLSREYGEYVVYEYVHKEKGALDKLVAQVLGEVVGLTA